MPIIDQKDVLKGILVHEAMRRLVVGILQQAPLAAAIRQTLKFKVNALLAMDGRRRGVGVVSKTDLMSAYYAGLPLDSPVEAIMVGPPLFCRPDLSLDQALDTMRTHKVHRIYVAGPDPDRAIGVLAYPDIVGILYRFCTKCEHNLRGRQGDGAKTVTIDAYRIGEVMTKGVVAHGQTDSLAQAMESLAANRLGALLITDADGGARGVISKTDLIGAYLHGISTDAPAATIMTCPVQSCERQEPILSALQQMIFADVHRLFVFHDDPGRVEGVFSLTDAARIRSGTCKACMTSRIRIN